MGPRWSRLVVGAGTLAAALLGFEVAPAGPLGAEFRVNTTTAGDQAGATVATDANDNLIVVWEGAGSGDSLGVFGQRLDAAGTKLGSEFRVNTTSAGDQAGPSVAFDSSRNLVVVWEGAGSGDSLGVFGQRFDASGNKLGSEFRVSTTSAGDQAGPSVAVDSNRNFVVVWEGAGSGDSLGVFGQRFDASGNKVGSEFRASTTSAGDQVGPKVDFDSNNNFVVVWDGAGSGDSLGVFGQRFNANGNKVGSEFRVSTASAGEQAGQELAFDSNRDFVVVWESASQDGSGFGVYGQRFDANGVKIGSEFRVNTATILDQASPTLDIDSSRNVVVTWESMGQDGGGLGVYAQRFDAAGAKLGLEFRVNTVTAGDQAGPTPAIDARGNFVVVWESSGQDGGGLGVFAQRFDFVPPDTSILSGPLSGSSTSGTLTFSSTETGSTFACALDGGAFGGCTSPKTYTGLSVGSHTFSVRATDLGANTDPTPAVHSWSVTGGSPPSVNLVRPVAGRLYVADVDVGPSGGSTTTIGALTVRAQATDQVSGIASMQFLVDGVPVDPSRVTFNSATSTYSFVWHLAPLPGDHTVTARATNSAGLSAATTGAVYGLGW